MLERNADTENHTTILGSLDAEDEPSVIDRGSKEVIVLGITGKRHCIRDNAYFDFFPGG